MKLRYVLITILISFVAICHAQVFIGDRTDFRDETIYFLMTTRFYDGDKVNNAACWDGNNPGLS